MAINNSSFVFGVSVSDYNFIGRQQESRTLKMNFEEGINTIIISPRRWGKTSLVKHVMTMVDQESVLTVYVDIFGCKSEYEFYNRLAEAVIKQTASSMERWMDNAKDFLARLSPKISISPEPLSDFSLSLGISPKTHSPEEVLSLAESIAIRRDKRIVICIDEFQQIGEMADSVSIQKRLRSVWQHQKHVAYCLFGSKKHMMSDIFQSKCMPFYQFGDLLFLPKIPTTEWVEYITSHFQDRRRSISTDLAARICKEVEGYSSYVQQLAWHVFSLLDEGDVVNDDHIDAALKNLLNSCEHLFMQQIIPLTEYQMNFLRAVIQGVHSEFGDSKIREQYNLGSASNITRLKTALTNAELIEADGRRIVITDPIFARWFKMRFID
ncbi:MAG: ATP-binding protein [Prevotellaceae bacterium]|nr:ATP-binding protein [Candidatus Minthosoma caballi]